MGHWLFALAVVAIPLSSGTKFLLGMPDLTWVNPTLALGAVVYALLRQRPVEMLSAGLLALVLVGMSLGSVLVVFGHAGTVGAYGVLREPIRLALSLVWFWTCISFVRREKAFVVRCLATSSLVQLGVAAYLWLGTVGWRNLPEPAYAYVREYAARQSLWFGDLAIPRLAGTFIESPPFGLFMFSCFVVLTIARYEERMGGRLVYLGWIASLVGALGSLSDQVLLGLVVFLSSWVLFHIPRQRLPAAWVLYGLMLVVATPYVVDRLGAKVKEAEPGYAEVYGRSAGERVFHVRYAAGLLARQPEFLPLGIGPGQYGSYAAETGLFPDTVTMQTTAAEWLVEYGLLGLLWIAVWMSAIAGRAHASFGYVGTGALLALLIANGFQANWKWESWFLALAYLYVGERRRTGRAGTDIAVV